MEDEPLNAYSSQYWDTYNRGLKKLFKQGKYICDRKKLC